MHPGHDLQDEDEGGEHEGQDYYVWAVVQGLQGARHERLDQRVDDGGQLVEEGGGLSPDGLEGGLWVLEVILEEFHGLLGEEACGSR